MKRYGRELYSLILFLGAYAVLTYLWPGAVFNLRDFLLALAIFGVTLFVFRAIRQRAEERAARRREAARSGRGRSRRKKKSSRVRR